MHARKQFLIAIDRYRRVVLYATKADCIGGLLVKNDQFSRIECNCENHRTVLYSMVMMSASATIVGMNEIAENRISFDPGDVMNWILMTVIEFDGSI
jgi:hypothetical protein